MGFFSLGSNNRWPLYYSSEASTFEASKEMHLYVHIHFAAPPIPDIAYQAFEIIRNNMKENTSKDAFT